MRARGKAWEIEIRNQSAVRIIASWRMEKAPLWLTSGDIRNQSAVRESEKTALYMTTLMPSMTTLCHAL